MFCGVQCGFLSKVLVAKLPVSSSLYLKEVGFGVSHPEPQKAGALVLGRILKILSVIFWFIFSLIFTNVFSI